MMNWRDYLTPGEAHTLGVYEDRRADRRGEVETLSQAIARIRNTCVNRARRASR